MSASNHFGSDATQSFTITVADSPAIADTPALPPWGLPVLATLLLLVATKTVPRRVT